MKLVKNENEKKNWKLKEIIKNKENEENNNTVKFVSV